MYPDNRVEYASLIMNGAETPNRCRSCWKKNQQASEIKERRTIFERHLRRGILSQRDVEYSSKLLVTMLLAFDLHSSKRKAPKVDHAIQPFEPLIGFGLSEVLLLGDLDEACAEHVADLAELLIGQRSSVEHLSLMEESAGKPTLARRLWEARTGG